MNYSFLASDHYILFSCEDRLEGKEELLCSCYWLAQYLPLCLCLLTWNVNLKGFCVS